MVKAVFDTNVWISSLLNPSGPPGKLAEAWRKNKCIVIISEPLLQELSRSLHYERVQKIKNIPEKEIQQLLNEIAHTTYFTEIASNVVIIEKDSTDNLVLATAIDGEADYIISGDHHLLDVGEYKGIQILTPAAFLQILEKK